MMIIFEYVDVVYMYVHLVHIFCLVRNGLFFTQSSKKKKKKKKNLCTELRTDFVLFVTILTYYVLMMSILPNCNAQFLSSCCHKCTDCQK